MISSSLVLLHIGDGNIEQCLRSTISFDGPNTVCRKYFTPIVFRAFYTMTVINSATRFKTNVIKRKETENVTRSSLSCRIRPRTRALYKNIKYFKTNMRIRGLFYVRLIVTTVFGGITFSRYRRINKRCSFRKRSRFRSDERSTISTRRKTNTRKTNVAVLVVRMYSQPPRAVTPPHHSQPHANEFRYYTNTIR